MLRCLVEKYYTGFVGEVFTKSVTESDVLYVNLQRCTYFGSFVISSSHTNADHDDAAAFPLHPQVVRMDHVAYRGLRAIWSILHAGVGLNVTH